MSDEAQSKRDLAIAEFFRAATEVLRLCVPLLKDAAVRSKKGGCAV